MELQRINNTQAREGDVIHAYGAIFKIKAVLSFSLSPGIHGVKPVAANIAEWVSGREEPGYFGRGKDFNFQGSHSAMIFIEPRKTQ
ncbi:hypothetical protein [Serratia plymuthica]|uniref:hypothetical protein n=1 Tax=Serratia plymuthica TaxID=82996 RepID=UPI0007EA634B|nr:hypothetical protein [Serratia plymuthica]ANJ92457.1 hypothetical protein ADP72_05470 [Serratia plymuthica]